MQSKSETGHAKNVANFEDLISFCSAYGADYNPSREAIKLASLQALHASAITQLHNVKTAKVVFDRATNARQIVFTPLRVTATKIINGLAASGASKQAVADARTINRKLQGVKAPSTKAAEPQSSENPTEPASKSISVSQQSYDSLIDHLAKLIELVSQEPSYAPNETDLQVAGLSVFMKEMQTSNTNVINAYTTWSNSRIQRSEIIYNPITGLIPIAFSVKLYVKSLYGASSPQYKQVSGLQFDPQADKK